MRYLVKSVNTWVIPSVEEVEKFHEELLEDNSKENKKEVVIHEPVK